MAEQQPDKWHRLPKLSFNSKALRRRVQKAENASVSHVHRFVVKRWDSFREVRSRIAIWVLTIGIIIGATGLQFWWYQGSYQTEVGVSGGMYAEAALGPLDTLNPIFAQSSAEESASELLFSRLLRYDTTGHLNYDLADSMKLSDDQKTYTFTMRTDARWSDGLYVRARDVVFTVNLIKNTATRSTLTGWDAVQVKEVNDHTVAFTLPSVYAAFPQALRFLPILPEHILRDIEPSRMRENTFSVQPVGSGPFTLRLLQDIDSSTGQRVAHLARNASYFRGAVKLDRFQLHVYRDTDQIKRALATSEVNAASDLSVIAASDVDTRRYTVEHERINSGVYALFNTASPLLQDQKVRAALRFATDTKALRESISPDLPELYLPFIDSQVNGAVPSKPVYDAKQAAALLDEAGWKLENGVRKKDGRELAIAAVTTKNPDFEQALHVLSEQWRAIGATITTSIVNPNDPAQNVAQDILQPRRFDVLVYQLTIGADPDVYAYWHSSQATGGYNFSNYKSAISDDALTSARARVEPELRNAKYLTFARQWLTDVPAIGLYQSTAQYVHTKRVSGIDSSSILISPEDRYNNVQYLTVDTGSVFTTP